MASDRDIIDFFGSSGNNNAVSVDDLQDMKDWVTGSRNLESPATPDDVVDRLYQFMDEQTFAKKRSEHVPVRIGNQP